MSKNVFSDQVFKNLLNQTVNLLSQQNYNTKTAFFLCPFQIVLGATLTTETGRKGLNARPKDYSQVQLAINSKDTISVYWRNSYSLKQNEDKTGIIKKYKVGDNFMGFVTNESLNLTTTSDYQRLLRIQTTKTFNCFVPKLLTGVNDEFFKLIEDEWFYFWQIPQFENRKENFDVISTITYFKIESWVYLRDNNNIILGAQVNFISINNEFQQNGLSLETYVQAGFPGEPKCFPILKKINEKGNYSVDINPTYFRYNPANAFQHTIIDLAGWMGAITMGFPITQKHLDDLNNKNEQLIQNPGAIWIYDILTPAEDKLLIKQLPETDYFVASGSLNINTNLGILRDLKNWAGQEFNPNPIQGFLKTDPATTRLSNNNEKFLTYWNNDFLKGNNVNYQKLFDKKAEFKLTANFWNSLPVYDVRGNDWFQANYKGTVYGIKRFNFGDVKNKDLRHFLMFNAICSKTLINLPATSKNNIPVVTKIIGMFSNIVNILTFGLWPEWKNKTIVKLPTNPKVNFLIPAEIYNNYCKLWIRTGVGDNFARFADKLFTFPGKVLGFSNPSQIPQNLPAGSIPLEVFLGGENQLTTTFGTSGTIQTFGGLITNKINTICYGVNVDKIIHCNVSTTDIGQIIAFKDSGHKYIPLYDEKTQLLSPDAKLDNYDTAYKNEIIGYMINVNSYKLIGGSAVQFKVYNLQTGSQQILDDEKSIYIDTYRTFSNYLKNPRLINNVHRLGNPLFDFNKVFSYPKDLFPVPPSPEAKEYIVKFNDINLQIPKEDVIDQKIILDKFDFKYNDTFHEGYSFTKIRNEFFNNKIKILIKKNSKYTFNLPIKNKNDKLIHVHARKITLEVDIAWWSAVNVNFYTGVLKAFLFQDLNVGTPHKLIRFKASEENMIAFGLDYYPSFAWRIKKIKLPNYGWRNIKHYPKPDPFTDPFNFKQNIALYGDLSDQAEFQPMLNFIINKNNKTWRLTRLMFGLAPFNINYIFKAVPTWGTTTNLWVKVWNANRGSFHFESRGIKNIKIEGLVMKFRKA